MVHAGNEHAMLAGNWMWGCERGSSRLMLLHADAGSTGGLMIRPNCWQNVCTTTTSTGGLLPTIPIRTEQFVMLTAFAVGVQIGRSA